MADFKTQGGTLAGREERYDGFEGEPRGVSTGVGSASSTTGTSGSGLTGHHSGHHTGSGTGTTGTTGTGYDNSYDSNTTGKKPSLMDRLNPMKDTDGDGKKGVMN